MLFEIPELDLPEPEPKVGVKNPIWTNSKAKLIERYLYYFVMITKHGTYIDGFAGPQEPSRPSMWSAKRVLESEPRWFRNFYPYDKDQEQFKRLEELQKGQLPRKPGEPKRTINIGRGDFNNEVHKLLAAGQVGKKEATFCLLDQRTFQCKWATVQALAQYKRERHKIELFYFLPNGWFSRAFAAVRNKSILEAWWGRDDWTEFGRMRAFDRTEAFISRFRELGYIYVHPWPIYDRPERGRRIMYNMIHATDHPSAPKLMERAYAKAVKPKESQAVLFAELGIG